MYTGIVEPGEVVKVERGDGTLTAWVHSPVFDGAAIGASISINGVCVTVTERDGDVCRFDATAETLQRSALGSLEAGERVNVERPLRAGDELGGHIVQGHVDAVGEVIGTVRDGDNLRVRVAARPDLMRYVVEKGSVTVDGVSLTVSALSDDWFEVALIPHTLQVTTFGRAKQGRKVNLEVDVLAKYVENMLSKKS
jgi:riboflavin synthase